MSNKYREIYIRPCLNGFSCSIGCQIAVYNNTDELINDLKRYFKDPKETEEVFLAGSLVWGGQELAPTRDEGVGVQGPPTLRGGLR